MLIVFIQFRLMNVVITGASKGFGKAIAKKFASHGHHLYLCSRNEHALYKAVDDLVTQFPEITVKAKPFDLSEKQQAISFGKWVLGFGIPIDIVVNNAGLFLPGSVHNEEDGVLEKMIEVNLYSAYHLSRV